MKLLDAQYSNHNKRCTKVEEGPNGCPVIHFEDGTTYEADVVIGADGVKSAVRSSVAEPGAMIWSNTYCYRGLIPAENLRATGMKTDVTKRPVCFLGKDKVGIHFLSGSSLIITDSLMIARYHVPN